MILDPDWKDFYTPEEAEYQFEGFEFKGIGWYETKDDTLLVLDQIPEDSKSKHAGRYEFWCWNSPNSRQAFAEDISRIIHMPVRVRV